MATLRQKTLVGVLWNFLEQVLIRGISALVTLVLAFYLSPSDFGLMAILTVFVALSNAIMDSGLQQALIRRDTVNQLDLDTLFISNILLGILAYLALFLIAPLISSYYEEPRLVDLIRVSGTVVFINSFHVVQMCIFSRELDFKSQFKLVLPAVLISSILAISCAYLGWGVWALVSQMLASSLIVTILFWLKSLWRPTFLASWDSFVSMYQFGYKLFLADLLEVLFKNLYVLVIAKLFSSATAGLYFIAEKLVDTLVLNIVNSIQRVTYPALAQTNQDVAKLKAGYKELIIITTFVLTPIILFLGSLSEEVFSIFLPQTWELAADFLEIMCLTAVFIPIHALNLNILKVCGRSDWSLLIEVLKKVVMLVILAYSLQFGVKGILLGQLVASIIAIFINCFFSKKLIDYSISEQLADFLPNLVLASIISIGIRQVSDFYIIDSVIQLMCTFCLAVLGYFFLAIRFRIRGAFIVKNLFHTRWKIYSSKKRMFND